MERGRFIYKFSCWFDNFDKLLKGAKRNGRTFQKRIFRKNIPVILALLSIWYNNFLVPKAKL